MEPINGRNKFSSLGDLPTHEPLFRQGHVGDLRHKSKIETEELLERQEKLLSNRGFVSRLPDRGAKIERFISSLKQRLDEIRTREDEIQLTDSLNTTPSSLETSVNESDESINQNSPQVDIKENVDEFESDLSVIEKGFSTLNIHEGPHYDVIKRAAQQPKQSKFMLNKLKTGKRLSSKSRESNPDQDESSGDVTDRGRSKQGTVRDLSSASISDPKHPSMLISIEESRTLYQKQEAIVKEQRSQLATERILSNYLNSEQSEFGEEEDKGSEGENTEDLEDVD